MNKKIKTAGFTLVELMIVVAIIGILASIAIPNYQKYQAKSRTSEAKLQLSAAYTAEKSFIVEYSSYTACLSAAGYTPDGSQRYYEIGFGGGAAPTGCGQTGTSCIDNLGTNAPTCTDVDGQTFFLASPSKVISVAGLTVPTRADMSGAATSNTFTIGAAGGIGKNGQSGTAAFDKWTIDDSKNLIQKNVGY